jgi:fatty acid desaturase
MQTGERPSRSKHPAEDYWDDPTVVKPSPLVLGLRMISIPYIQTIRMREARGMGMNKKQARIAWAAAILLSILAVIVGILLVNSSLSGYGEEKIGQQVLGILVMVGIPILLLFGLAFFRSGQKSKSTQQ